MKPHIHAENSAKKFGGVPDDYLDIHELMDSSKAIVANNLHRMFTHNSWFIRVILPRIFGQTIVNSDGKTVSIYDIGEQHVLEDFRGRYIPSAQDYVNLVETYPEWVNGVEGSPRELQDPNYIYRHTVPTLGVEHDGVISKPVKISIDSNPIYVDGSSINKPEKLKTDNPFALTNFPCHTD